MNSHVPSSHGYQFPPQTISAQKLLLNPESNTSG